MTKTLIPGMDRQNEAHKNAFRQMAEKTTAKPYVKMTVIEPGQKEEVKVENNDDKI